MSIFKKDCPQCAAPNAVDAPQCECGYCFDPDALAAADATAYAEEQDRLYLDYLAARIAQAEAEAIVARERANAERSDTLKTAAALVAEQTLSALQAEMKQLAARVVPRSKPAPTPARAKPAPAVTSIGLSKSGKSAERSHSVQTTTPRFNASKPKSIEKRARASSDVAASSRKLAAAKPSTPAGDAISRTHAAKTPAVDQTRAVGTPATARGEAAATSKVATHRFATKPSAAKPSAVPNTRFRIVQARKAEAIARTLPPSPVAAPEGSSAMTTVNETAKPHATSILHSQRDARLQSCPSCGASVPVDLDRCRCGYAFARATDVPALTPEAPIALAPVDNEPTQDCPNCTAVIPIERTQCNCGYTFSRAEQVPAITLDATALSILTNGVARSRER